MYISKNNILRPIRSERLTLQMSQTQTRNLEGRART